MPREALHLQDEAGTARDVFLYSRSLMVAGPQALDPESLPAIRVDGVLEPLQNLVSSCHAPHEARAPLLRRRRAVTCSP